MFEADVPENLVCASFYAKGALILHPALAEQVHSANTANKNEFASRKKEKWQNLPCTSAGGPAYPNWERLPMSTRIRRGTTSGNCSEMDPYPL